MGEKIELRILFLEDFVTDYELAKLELERNGFQFQSLRVDTKEAFLSAVKDFKPDMIISDYMMPSFTGLEALKLSLDFSPKIPFIILTGSMNEETAVECLKNGAADYVIKEMIGGLPFSVKEVLQQKKLTAQKEKAEKSLIQSEKAYRLLFEANPQPMWVLEIPNQNFLAVNEAAIAKYGYSKEEFLSFRLMNILPLDDIEKFQKYNRKNQQDSRNAIATRHQLKDGSIRFVDVFSNRIKFEGKNARLVLSIDITEKIKAEKSLLQSEENFRRSIENSPLGIRIVNMDGVTIYANKTFLDIYEYSNLDEFKATSAKLSYSDESYLEHQNRKKIRKSGGEVSDYSITIRRISGELRHIKVNRNEVVWNGEIHFQVINQDITEQKNAEIKLRKLSQAVEQSPGTIIITDIKGIIEYANPSATILTGYSTQELIGQTPKIFSSGEMSKEKYTILWETILAGKVWIGEFLDRNKNGELYWAAATIAPVFDIKGQITNFLAIKEDITEDKIMLEELIAAKEKAEESDRLKTSFLGNVSHEIRTPMNSILGFAELLEDEDLSHENQSEYLQIIKKSGQRMLETLHSIVEIAKIEAGQLSVTETSINISQQIRDIRDMFIPEARLKGLTLKCDCANTCDSDRLYTDQKKLEGILINLVKNAIKFTNTGEILIGYRIKNKVIEFFVNDTGIGIDPSLTSIIFDRFRQGNISLARGHEGSGLGLSIAKAYVEKLGGNIWFESEIGKGTKFYFTIPFNTESDIIEVNQTINKYTKPFNQTNLKVLICEVDDSNLMYLRHVLTGISKKVLFARNGLEAIEIFKANPDINIILIDIQMLEMDGYEAIRQIREINSNVCIIAQTAHALSDGKKKFLAAGCDDYITKPFKKDKLLDIIQNWFNSKLLQMK